MDKDSTQQNTEEAGSDNDDDDEEEMPSKWYWPGFLSFVLYGPIIPDDMDDTYKAITFMTSDSDRKKRSELGRAIARKKRADDAARERELAPTTDGRGLNNNQQLYLASIAQQSSWTRVFEGTTSSNSTQLYLMQNVANAQKEIDGWMKLCKNIQFGGESLQTNFINDIGSPIKMERKNSCYIR